MRIIIIKILKRLIKYLSYKKCKTCKKKFHFYIHDNDKYCSFECYNKSRIGKKPSKEIIRKRYFDHSKMKSWKGDKVSYGVLHKWVRRHKPPQKLCEECGKERELELANISGKYLRDINDFEWLCKKCHKIKDKKRNE